MANNQQFPYHSYPLEDTLKQLKVDPDKGLSFEEVDQRREQYGWNEIPEERQTNPILLFFKQFKDFLVIILIIAAAISYFSGHYVDVYVIIVVIFLNAAIGFTQEYKAGKAILALKKMIVQTARVIRHGQKREVAARELVPGDIVELEEGDSIPADLRIIYAKNLRAIEASLTGESLPVKKHEDVYPEKTPFADRGNMLWKSTHIAGGFGKGVVIATGPETAIGTIATSLEKINESTSHFREKTTKLGKQMGILSIVFSALIFVLGYFISGIEFQEMLLVTIATLVAVIPEGLPAVLSIVLAVGANKMARRKAIIREFTATETLGAVSVILTDKTGTITQNSLTVKKIFYNNNSEIDVTGDGWAPAGEFIKNGEIIDPEKDKDLMQGLEIAAFSNNATLQPENDHNEYQITGDPTEGALLVLAEKSHIKELSPYSQYKKIDDLPFNSELKLRATLVKSPDNIKKLLVVGAPEKILASCTHAYANGSILKIKKESKKIIQEKMEKWAEDSLRVIALAYQNLPGNGKEADLKIKENNLDNLIWAGMVGIMDPPRADIKKSVDLCRQAGIRVIMATGDHKKTAEAIARQVGIIDNKHDPHQPQVVTESEIEMLDDENLDKVIQKVSVFARLTPAMKLRIAERLQHMGYLIGMTGDGVNDAPALKKADVGIAMGMRGTDVAREAAQIVLSDDNFNTIVNAVEEGRIVFNNVRQTSFFLLTTNFASLIAIMTNIFAGLPIPLTATQILWLNMVTDGVMTVSMATERGHGDEMEDKPINKKENILTGKVIPYLLINAIIMTVLTVGVFIFFLPEGLDKARAGAFVAMAMTQVINAWNMRSLKKSAFKIGLFSNKIINLAMVASLILQFSVTQIPFFKSIFGFGDMNIWEFLIITLLSTFVLWVGEIYKIISKPKPINQ